jgi:hypothetical protein
MPASPHNNVINLHLLVDRFGRWPSFHDAEVLSLNLNRRAPISPSCEMVIHAWIMTNQVDSRGYFMLEKHTLVTLRLEELIESQFLDFNHQNCLSDLWVVEEIFENEPALRVQFPSNYGLEGSALCRRVVVVSVQPCDERGQLPAVS